MPAESAYLDPNPALAGMVEYSHIIESAMLTFCRLRTYFIS